MSIVTLTALVLASPPAPRDSRDPQGAPPEVPWPSDPDPSAATPPAAPEVLAPASRPAPQATPAALPGWTAGAFVDTAYLFNNNLPDNHIYRGTSTTPRTGEFTVNLAAAYLKHTPSATEPWRLEIGLQAGAAADALYASEPTPGAADGRLGGPEVWKHVALANAGAQIASSGTEIGAGLFASPIGIGGFWSPFNWNYTPSWESNAAPFYFSGVRVLQELPAGFGLQAWVVNGWQTIGDVNHAPAYLAGVTYDRAVGRGELNLAQFVYAGPDDADLTPEAWRVHSDTQATWTGPRGGVGVVWDYGMEKLPSRAGNPVHRWSGGGIFTRLALVDRPDAQFDIALRPDAWWDQGGRIYGVDQWLLSGTGTANVRLFGVLLVRAEYRYDRSTASEGFFYRASATSDDANDLAWDQHTVLMNVAGAFERPLPARRKTR